MQEAKESSKRVEQLERELAVVAKKADDAAAALSANERGLRSKMEALAFFEQQEAHNKKKMAEYEAKVTALQKECDLARASGEEWHRAQSAAGKELSHYKEALGLQEGSVRKKEEEIQGLNKSIRSLQQQLEQKDAELQRSKNEVRRQEPWILFLLGLCGIRLTDRRLR